MRPTPIIIALFIAGLIACATKAEADWVTDYDALLQKYVTSEGVRYAAWHADTDDVAALQAIVEHISKTPVNPQPKEARLAFYLNAYNAWILHHILRDYPTDGPGGGGFIGRTKFFKRKDITVAGQDTSFHLLENEVIRPDFDEPRIHFALNCASASCPPLHKHAFTAENLDTTLDALTIAFINENPDGLTTDDRGRVTISKIFDWYEDDFQSPGSTLAYLNQYLTSPLPSGTKLAYHPYRWTLNATD